MSGRDKMETQAVGQDRNFWRTLPCSAQGAQRTLAGPLVPDDWDWLAHGCVKKNWLKMGLIEKSPPYFTYRIWGSDLWKVMVSVEPSGMGLVSL